VPKISELPPAGAVFPTDQLEANQAGVSHRITVAQVAATIGGAYLPLAGGTLSGALTGTTATFSDKVNIANDYQIDGKSVLFETPSTFTAIAAMDGHIGLHVGPVETFYRATTHHIQNMDGSGEPVLISLTTMTVNVPLTGTSATFNGPVTVNGPLATGALSLTPENNPSEGGNIVWQGATNATRHLNTDLFDDHWRAFSYLKAGGGIVSVFDADMVTGNILLQNHVGIGGAPLNNVKLLLQGQTVATDWLIYGTNSVGTATFSVNDSGNVSTAGTLTGTTATFSGNVTHNSTLAVGAGAATQAFVKASSTADLGIYFGTGAPTFAAAKGSLYTNTAATTTTTRLYVNTSGSTTWTNLTTAA